MYTSAWERAENSGSLFKSQKTKREEQLQREVQEIVGKQVQDTQSVENRQCKSQSLRSKKLDGDIQKPRPLYRVRQVDLTQNEIVQNVSDGKQEETFRVKVEHRREANRK